MPGMGTEQVPIAPGLFTWPSDEPRLIGSRCAACGVMTFPQHGPTAPDCASDAMEETLFERRGRSGPAPSRGSGRSRRRT